MVTAKLMTADELLMMKDDGYRHELIRGELQRMPPGGEEHGETGIEIGSLMRNHARARKLGRTQGPDTGFVISENFDTVLAPDVSFVRAERLDPNRITSYLRLAPDLVVEIISPSDRLTDGRQKIATHLAAGVRLLWLVALRARTVTVYQTGQEPRTLQATDILDGSNVLPGFRVTVADLFPED